MTTGRINQVSIGWKGRRGERVSAPPPGTQPRGRSRNCGRRLRPADAEGEFSTATL